jgi:hypothetical protein
VQSLGERDRTKQELKEHGDGMGLCSSLRTGQNTGLFVFTGALMFEDSGPRIAAGIGPRGHDSYMRCKDPDSGFLKEILAQAIRSIVVFLKEILAVCPSQRIACTLWPTTMCSQDQPPSSMVI